MGVAEFDADSDDGLVVFVEPLEFFGYSLF